MNKLTSIMSVFTFFLVFPAIMNAESPMTNSPIEKTKTLDSKASASEDMEDLFFFAAKPVSVASSQGEETVFNSVSSVSIIDRDTIDRYNFSSISQAVEILAGISVWRTYLKKRIPIVRGILQDHYANKVLVMINNIPVWHPVTGEGDLDRVSIHDVERIEVLKGPASVLYGSNAYTGAINIVLRKAKAGTSTSTLHGGIGSGPGGYQGSITSHQAGGYYAKSEKNFNLFMAANTTKEDWPEHEFTAEGGETVTTNEYLNLSNFTLQGRYHHHSLLINSSLNQELYLGVVPRVTHGVDRNQEIELHMINYAYDHQFNDLKVHYSLLYDWSRRNYSRSLDNNTRADIIGSRLVNQIQLNYSFLKDWTAELGGDHEFRYSKAFTNYLAYENEVITENNLLDRQVTAYSGRLQLQYSKDALKVLLGTRLTQNELFGSNISSRGTVVYAFNPTNSVKLIAGQSYRAPSLFEQNFVTLPGLTVFGNSDLNPELSTSVELAYLTSFKQLFVQVVGYYATYENKIARARGSAEYNGITYNDVNVYQNGGKITAQGAELEIEYKLQTTHLFMSLDYVVGNDGDKVYETADDRYHYNFKYVPVAMLSAGVSQSLGNFFASGLVNYYSGMDGPDNSIDANYTIDATLGYKADNISHTLSARNLGNNHVTVPEYVRRNLNEITLISGMRLDYGFIINF